jgi:hypothetical protein
MTAKTYGDVGENCNAAANIDKAQLVRLNHGV